MLAGLAEHGGRTQEGKGSGAALNKVEEAVGQLVCHIPSSLCFFFDFVDSSVKCAVLANRNYRNLLISIIAHFVPNSKKNVGGRAKRHS